MLFNFGYPRDWSTLKKLIWLRGSGTGGASLPWATFTGNPLEFDAPKAHALKSCVIDIEPIQSGSGDPSPDNVRPISGWTEANVYRTGKNLYTGEIAQGGINASGDNDPNNKRLRTGYIRVSPSTEYVLSVETGKKFVAVHYYDINKNSISANITTNPYTTPSNCAYARYMVGFTDESDIQVSDLTSLQIELGGTPTPYEAPTNSSLTLPFGQTVYGGNASYNGDGTWTVTSEWGMTDLGTLNWTYDATSKRFASGGNAIPIKPISSGKSSMICSIFKTVTGQSQIDNLTVDATISQGTGSSAIIRARDLAYTDKTAFKTAMSGVQLCYPLATPTTFTITTAELFDALQGRNVMWTDCSNLTVEAKGTAVTP